MTTLTYKHTQGITDWTYLTSIHQDLRLAKELVYDPCILNCSPPIAAPESVDYAACSFSINDLAIQYRAAKITPTKTGQFVTVWKREGRGPIAPFDSTDNLDFIIVSVRREAFLGQFIFPKTVLLKKGIISHANKKGKRGLRVYPPWDNVNNKQAQQTQAWQAEYFIPIIGNEPTDLLQVRKLFTSTV